jgi:hypothetical protein
VLDTTDHASGFMLLTGSRSRWKMQELDQVAFGILQGGDP